MLAILHSLGPSNPPHHRSGAALYYIIAGTGANTVAAKTEAKGPGSLVYEPFGVVHQWGNGDAACSPGSACIKNLSERE
jgi:quercetin dioxygenase-like cupin family protein